MNIELYDHQIKVLPNIRNGAILRGGTGSGKSRIGLMYFYTRVLDGKISINGKGDFVPSKIKKDLYIITTAEKRNKEEWLDEMMPFCFDTSNKIKVVVDSWNNIQKYIKVKNAFFLFDEHHAIGSGSWASSLIKISKNNQWIILTATPGDKVENWSTVFIANNFCANRTDFSYRYIVLNPYIKYPVVLRYTNMDEFDYYRKQIEIVVDYKSKNKKIQKYINHKYDIALEKIVTEKRWNFIKNRPIRNKAEYYYLLRMISNTDPSRLRTLEKLYNKNHRLLIFYNFDYELDILRSWAQLNNISYGELNGHKKTAIPNTDKWVHLIQYTSGAEAWNCIITDTVVFYSLSYSYRDTLQSEGRIDRLNTPFNTLYYYYLVNDSKVDKLILKAQAKKEKFNEPPI